MDGQPRVWVYLMPDNASTGELEDFVMQMIPEGDPVWPRFKRYIGEIPQADRKFPEIKTHSGLNFMRGSRLGRIPDK